MSNNFDEASAATQALFAQEQLSPDNAPDLEEDTPVNDTGEPTGNPLVAETPQANVEETAQTAELAAQVASEKDGQLQQALNDIESLKQQNQQLQGTIDELSQRNAETIIDEVQEIPTLDINGLAFADEATQQAAMSKFAEELSKYNRKQLMEELSPAIEYAKKGMREAEKTEVLEVLSQIPELSGIKEVVPQLDRLIESNKFLASDDMPMDEKYINAFAIAKGINSINNPPAQPELRKEPTPEELLELYNNSRTFQELVEKQRIDAIKNSQQVPPLSASSGTVNAPLNIKEKPQTMEEASKRTREMFSGMQPQNKFILGDDY